MRRLLRAVWVRRFKAVFALSLAGLVLGVGWAVHPGAGIALGCLVTGYLSLLPDPEKESK